MRQFWNIFFVVGAFMSIVLSVFTVELSPPAWQDEAQILAFGAGVFNSPQGMNYVLDPSGTTTPALCFAGSALAYASWITLPGAFGHRYLMLAIAIVSAFLLYKVSSKNLGNFSATVFSLSWLFEPSLCQSYRGGRVDILALFLVLFSVAMWCGRKNSSSQITRLLKICGAGACLMLAELTWISTVLCLPFLFAVLYLEQLKNNQSLPSLVKDLILFGAAGLVLLCSAILAMPELFSEALSSTLGQSQNQISSIRISGFLPSLMEASKLSIATICAAVVSIVAIKNKNERLCLMIAIVSTLILVIATRAYVHRFVYALPMLFLIIHSGLSHPTITKDIKNVILGILAGVGILTSGLARNINALTLYEDRNYHNLKEAIDLIGVAPNETVYDGSWQLFLASKNYFRPIRYWGHTYGPSLAPDSNAMFQSDWVFLSIERPDSVATALMLNGYQERILTTKASAYGPYSVWHQHEND
jgi:hypothetical protein